MKITDNKEIIDIYSGNIEIMSGGHLILNGMIVDDSEIFVLPNATADIYGTVEGTIHNKGGIVNIFGIVKTLDRSHGTNNIASGGKVFETINTVL